MPDRLTRRALQRLAIAAPFVALALKSDGARPARAATSCALPERYCVDRLSGEPACPFFCSLFCAGRLGETCAACAICPRPAV